MSEINYKKILSVVDNKERKEILQLVTYFKEIIDRERLNAGYKKRIEELVEKSYNYGFEYGYEAGYDAGEEVGTYGGYL